MPFSNVFACMASGRQMSEWQNVPAFGRVLVGLYCVLLESAVI